MIRTFLLSFLLFAVSCSGQKTKEQSTITDTLHLLGPKSEPLSAEDTLMFKNSIVLFKPDYILIYDSTENTYNNLNSLSLHINLAATLLKQRKFYVLTDSNTKPDKIVSVLDLLQENKIDNYKLINIQEYFKSSEPVTYQAPTKTEKVTEVFDSSYFSIRVSESNIVLSLLAKKQTVKNYKEVDEFIANNKSLIDPKKIVILGDSKTTYSQFKLLLDILRKHEYYEFKMVSQ